MKRLLLTKILIVCSILVAQSINRSDRLQPQWITKQLPEPLSGTYIFVKSKGTGGSLTAARQACLVDLGNYLESERGLVINSYIHQQSSMTTTHTYDERFNKNAKMSYKSTQQDDFTLEVIENGRKIDITCRTIDEYWEEKSGIYHVTTLYTVTKSAYGSSYNDKISTTNQYSPIVGLMSIVPGAGQMYKGDFGKGVTFLTAGVAGAASIVLCECTRYGYAAKVQQQPQYALEYNTRASNWATGRNVCIGITAGIWLWNIIDALVAKGSRRVIVEPRGGYWSMQSSSIINPINQAGELNVGVAYHF